MLVQALAEYADTYLADQLNEEAWEEKPVPYFIALDAGGTFLNVVPNNVSAVRGKKTVSVPASLPVARSPVPRNAGLYPLLAADDIKYVLGAGPWTPKNQEENNRERHEAFAALIRQAATETDDEALQAAAAFYARPDQVEAARATLAAAKPGSILALALLNQPIVRRPAVRAYWSKLYAVAASGRVAQGGDAECLISGKIGPIAPTHEKIKGLASLGGQSSGVSLMSFDKEAFRSYGWEQNANSPVAPDRAMAYVLALNDLLRSDEKHRRDIPGVVGFLFWTKKPTKIDPMATVYQPRLEQVHSLLKLEEVEIDPNMFYMLGVAANGGRMLIRYWIAKTLAEVKKNVDDWHEALRVVDVFTGKPPAPPGVWQLLYAIEREGKPPSDRGVALIRRAIEGPSQPLGYPMLAAALSRLRAEPRKRRDATRAGFIRLCLNDNIRLRNKGERPMEESLDTGQKHEAYLCGRLMAVYESLQHKALGKVNQNVIDRYYVLASTYPEIAFPKLAILSKSHLRRLRPPHYGAMVRFSRDIDQLHSEIGEASGRKYPKVFDIDGQGRFALGYHHQHAYQFAQARAASENTEDQVSSETIQENS